MIHERVISVDELKTAQRVHMIHSVRKWIDAMHDEVQEVADVEGNSVLVGHRARSA